ncbi:MAG: PEP-CTERM sorting domain-containing protein [Bradyrhizobium sp.]|nr:PEP-CTERM sorting domain-containing protein [Bradyrhizobium sp.]
MIRYLARVHNCWRWVTTTRAIWARLPHVAGVVAATGCGVTVWVSLHQPPPAAPPAPPVAQVAEPPPASYLYMPPIQNSGPCCGSTSWPGPSVGPSDLPPGQGPVSTPEPAPGLLLAVGTAGIMLTRRKLTNDR